LDTKKVTRYRSKEEKIVAHVRENEVHELTLVLLRRGPMDRLIEVIGALR